MEDLVIIDWTYTPENYFEDEIEEDRGTFKLGIANGKVRATFSASVYDENKIAIDDIHNEIRALFLGVQVVSHESFNLSKYTMYRQHPDGGRDVTVFPDSCVMNMTSGTVDLVVADSEGNIISDTRADRIREKVEFAKLYAKHSRTDLTARRMLSSYEAAVHDPANELVHLYEIKDALKKKFRKEKTAKTLLGISEKDWSNLGRLSNHEPLKQGRHRGQNIDNLRDATAGELADARRIAKRLIFAYLKYID